MEGRMGSYQTLDSSKLKNQFGDMIDKALKGQATVIERYGRKSVAVISYDDFEEYQKLKEREARSAS
jgi:prevent-host-death family protein